MFYCLLTALDYDNDSDPPLAHKAAAAGDVPLLVQAIKHDPGVIQQSDSEGMYFTHLHAVLHNGCTFPPRLFEIHKIAVFPLAFIAG